MIATDEELQKARDWWRNLSNNQMNEFWKKHFPNYSWEVVRTKYNIHKMWENEGKPPPQELIPVDPRFLDPRFYPNH